MKIRSYDVSASDIASSSLFFKTLANFYDLKDAEVLDMFARDGTITVSQYIGRVKAVDCWELMGEHRLLLSQHQPREIIIGCSYAAMRQCKKTYDMIVIDTPQGIHTDFAGNQRIEHFDVMKQIGDLLKDRALIVLYVNKSPYDKNKVGSHGYDEYESYNYGEWLSRRAAFYHHDPLTLTEEAAIGAYRATLRSQGIAVKSVLTVPCYSDVEGIPPYAFRLALEVAR